MIVVGFDTETTGFDPNTAHIIEMGAAIFDVKNGDWKTLARVNTLIYDESYFPLPLAAKEANGITEELLREKGVPLADALAELSQLVTEFEPEVAIAHNAPFDKGMLGAEEKRIGLTSGMMSIPWLCSMNDNELIAAKKCRKLSHVALDFGVAVDPAELHRALGDVILMGKLLSAVKADPAEMLRSKNEPSVIIAGKVKKPWDDDGKDKDLAKSEGYSWEKAGDRSYPKRWVKAVKKHKLHLEKREYIILEEL